MSPKPENQTLELMIRSTMFDRPRQLLLDPEYLQFDDQDKVSESPTRFLTEEIESFRYGVKAIMGYRFRIGRIYSIDIRDVSGRIMKIRLKSVYGVRVKQLNHKYASIVNHLYNGYFRPVTLAYYKQFQNGENVELLGVSLNQEGVLFDEKVGRVSWNFIGLKRYWHYFTLYSEESPDQYRAFVPAEVWNTSILRQLIEMILREKFPQRKLEE